MKSIALQSICVINKLTGSSKTGQLDEHRIMKRASSCMRAPKLLALIKQLIKEYKNA